MNISVELFKSKHIYFIAYSGRYVFIKVLERENIINQQEFCCLLNFNNPTIIMNREDVKKTAFIFFDNIREGRFPNCVLRVPSRYYSIVVAESRLLTVLDCTASLAS